MILLVSVEGDVAGKEKRSVHIQKFRSTWKSVNMSKTNFNNSSKKLSISSKYYVNSLSRKTDQNNAIELFQFKLHFTLNYNLKTVS